MNLKRNSLSEKKKKFPRVYILYYSIYKTFLKRQNYKNGDYISGRQCLRKEWAQKESDSGYKGTRQRVLMGCKYSMLQLSF